MHLPNRLPLALFGVALLLALTNAFAVSQPLCEERHPMNDAWFTGPMLANTAATAPHGHFLIEPYLYDVTTQGRYDRKGNRQSVPHANSYGSLTYLIYGITDRLAFGVLPTAGYNTVTGEPSSAGIGIGDLTLLLQRRLTQFRPCGRMPILSIAVQQTLPTGRYDNLGNRPANGFGQGVYTTTPAIYSQMYFWLPNHRILRARLDISDSFSRSTSLAGASVYGTGSGFQGSTRPGSSLYVDASLEYSLTRSWVLAADSTWRGTGSTRVSGSYGPGSSSGSGPTTVNSGWSEAWGLAPAIEYSWKPSLGVLIGVRLIPGGRNTSDTISPAIALNIVH
jgi:hypothetical protein